MANTDETPAEKPQRTDKRGAPPPAASSHERDQFASLALSGMIASGDHRGLVDWDALASTAFKVADAMLAAREKPAEPKPET